MSFENLVKHKFKKKKDKILTPKSEKLMDLIIALWITIAYLIASIIFHNNIDITNRLFFDEINNFFPGIYKNATGSKYPEAMYFVWVYVYFTTPVLFLSFVLFTNKFNKPILPTSTFIMLFLSLLLSVYGLLGYIELGGEDANGRLGNLYYKYLLFSTVASCGFGVLISISIFFLFNHFKGIKPR